MIFHERSESRDEHEEHEEGNEGKHRGNTRKRLNQQEIVTHVLDPRVHKRTHDPRTTKDDTKVASLLREEVLMFSSLGGLESKGIFSEEGRRSLSWSRSDVDEQCSVSRYELNQC